ncbi:MAG: PEP-CTERM sorting domain-containing protein [Burkholderiaceae bacterium]
MNKFRLLASALILSISGSIHASALLTEVNGIGNSGSNVITDESTSAYVQHGIVSDDTNRSNSPNVNYVKANVPYYFESSRMSHVPEPEGWAMMLLGAGFVIFQVRRRRRARESWDLR